MAALHKKKAKKATTDLIAKMRKKMGKTGKPSKNKGKKRSRKQRLLDEGHGVIPPSPADSDDDRVDFGIGNTAVDVAMPPAAAVAAAAAPPPPPAAVTGSDGSIFSGTDNNALAYFDRLEEYRNTMINKQKKNKRKKKAPKPNHRTSSLSSSSSSSSSSSAPHDLDEDDILADIFGTNDLISKK